MPDHDAPAPAFDDRYHIMRMASADVCRQAATLCARAAWALAAARATGARLREVRRRAAGFHRAVRIAGGIGAVRGE